MVISKKDDEKFFDLLHKAKGDPLKYGIGGSVPVRMTEIRNRMERFNTILSYN